MSNQPQTLDHVAILDEHGHRKYVFPADVHGRWSRLKPLVYTILIVFYAVLPWVEVGGHPAVLIDIPERRFYLFGNTYNAQDFYLAFFFLTGIGFTLIVVSALWGRLWCGWACPQTVFLEGVFRRIERIIEGPAQTRRALALGPWTFEKIWKKSLKHALYVLMAFLIAHIFLSYFVSLPRVFEMVRHNPLENWTAFLWAFGMTAIIYGNFWWFREQLCLVICPYGRLQSAMQDDDTLIIGYDKLRGEPRGKVTDPTAGACVSCNRCVAVCPTGIDIRNGLQLECVGCAACIDACDEIMDKVGRPRGLIRYDSLNGIEGRPRRFWRPRVLYYAIAGAVGLSVATFFFVRHKPFEANVLHVQGAPFVVDNGTLRNQLTIHLINKQPRESVFTLEGAGADGVTFIIPQAEVKVESLGSRQLPVVVSLPREDFHPGQKVSLKIVDTGTGNVRDLSVDVLGPTGSL